MDLKKSQPESLGGKLYSAMHLAAAAAYRSSAFSFAFVMSDKTMGMKVMKDARSDSSAVTMNQVTVFARIKAGERGGVQDFFEAKNVS